MHYTLQDVEHLDQLVLYLWVCLHSSIIKSEDSLDDPVQLGYVAFEILTEIFMYPKAC